ncbi:MAG TPA: ABC transporter substrate-binding protein [Acidimicrobiales bacterium]|nr:ABC transporter substrate-binding protein [Acidimicrobiales bacterium]
MGKSDSTWRPAWAVALVAVLLAATAACGDADDDSAGGSSSGSDGGSSGGECDVPGISDDEIKIGALTALSGPYAPFYGPVASGWTARIEEQNAAGGVGGREITIESADDGTEVNAGLSAARRLVEEEGVYAMLVASTVTAGFAEYLNQEGIPVAGYNVNPEWGMYDNMFGGLGSNSPDPVATTTIGDFLVDQGVTKLAVIAYSTPGTQAAAEQGAASFEAAGGEVVLKSLDAPASNVEWTQQAGEVAESGADGVFIPIPTPSAVPAYAAIRQAGVEPKVALLPAGYSPATIDQAGEAAEGLVFSLNFVPFEQEVEGHRRILDALEQYAPDAPRSAETVAGYLGADVLIRGLEEAGAECPTREAFVENLRQVDDYDAGGVLNPALDFEEGFAQPLLRCLHFVRIEGGEFVPLTEGEALCGDVVG